MDIENGEDEIFALICTSGTTGPPKLVTLAHKNWVYIFNISIRHIVTPVVCCLNTFNWVSGLSNLFSALFAGQMRVTTSQTFSPQLLTDMILKYKINNFLITPVHLQLFYTEAARQNLVFPSVKMCFAIGNKLHPKLRLECQSSIFPNALFMSGFGMSEIFGVSVIINSPDSNCQGMLLPNLQLKIVDDHMKPLGTGEVGEVCIKPAMKFKVQWLFICTIYCHKVRLRMETVYAESCEFLTCISRILHHESVSYTGICE